MRYRLQRHDGTDCSATMVPITVLRMVPIQRYRHLFSLFWPIFNFTYRSKLYICSQFMLKQIKSIRAKLDKFIFSVHPFNPCFVDKDKLR